MFFEEMGLRYFGPIDGHDINLAINTFNSVNSIKGPKIIHFITRKGKGYLPAEKEPLRFHSAKPFNIETGTVKAGLDKKKISFTEAFSMAVLGIAGENEKVIAVTAAMQDGTGLKEFSARFPGRFFDVGIAEQHAIGFCAGFSKFGFVPVAAIYSTFLQRAYDQIIHDVALQKSKVILAVDRAGLIGEDGPTHHGVYDLAYLRHIPNMVIMAPKDGEELSFMLQAAVDIPGPVAIRYPRGNGYGVELGEACELPAGRAEVLEEGDAGLVIAVGTRVRDSLQAVETLRKEDARAFSLLNLRFIKPLDEQTILSQLKADKPLLVVEEGVARGGIGEHIAVIALKSGWSGPFIHIAMPDVFPEHGTQAEILHELDLDADGIVKHLRNM